MASIQAVIFDIDDTLYAERDYVFSGYRAVADAFAARIGAKFDLHARLCSLFDTPERPRVFNAVLAEAGRSGADAAALVGEMVACYREHMPTIALLPEARVLLAALRGRVRLGVISDGYLITQQRKSAALGLADLVDEIILTDAWGREYWKPHPRAFEEMAIRLNLPHAACAYLSDNPAKDFVAPNALGWRTVLVDRPGRVYAGVAAAAGGIPQRTIQSLAEACGELGLDAPATGRG